MDILTTSISLCTKQAFRIVTTLVNPAILLKNAQKTLQEGFQSARERLSMGGSTFSSSSSLVGSDEEKAVRRDMPPPSTNRWNQQAKRASFQRVGASLSSFESTGSESSAGMGPSSHSNKLFPIPQGRVMTESSRNLSLDSEGREINISLTERTSNMSERSKSEDGEQLESAVQKEKVHSTPVEKRASEVSAEEQALAEPNGSPKRLRSKAKADKEQCTIQ